MTKERLDDVNNFTKAFAHILNFEFYRLYYMQIFMCATVNVKTMLLDFFYLRATNYQLNSSPYDYKFCYTLLCTCVYKISKLIHNTYTKILSGYKSKNVHAYRICKLVHDSYH